MLIGDFRFSLKILNAENTVMANVQKYHDLYRKLGEDLVKDMMDVTNRCDWEDFDTYRFSMNGEKVFDIESHNSIGQTRNAVVKFWIRKDWYDAPEYDDLIRYLGRGTAAKLEAFLDTELDEMNADPCNLRFQIFVLFQFEIARRVRGEDEGIPDRRKTKHAIDIAMDLDTHEAYGVLINMFSANYDARLDYYEELVRYSPLSFLNFSESGSYRKYVTN